MSIYVSYKSVTSQLQVRYKSGTSQLQISYKSVTSQLHLSLAYRAYHMHMELTMQSLLYEAYHTGCGNRFGTPLSIRQLTMQKLQLSLTQKNLGLLKWAQPAIQGTCMTKLPLFMTDFLVTRWHHTLNILNFIMDFYDNLIKIFS